MDELVGIFAVVLIFGGCGCALPILAIYFGTKTERDKNERKTQVMLKAIENGQKIDPQMFAGANKTTKNIKMSLLTKLKSGIIWGLIGIGIIITNFLSLIRLDEEFFETVFYIAGIVALAIGIANITFYIVGRKQLKGEMKAELEKAEAEAEKAKKEAELANGTLE